MSRRLSLLYFQLLNCIQMSVHVSCSVFLAPPVTRRMIPFDFAFCYSLFFFCRILYVEQLLFLDVLFLVILFAFFVGRFFPDSHSSALVRISLRFERTEVRSLPLSLSSHSSFQLGCLHAASLQPHRASLTPLGRVRVPLVFVRVISGIPSLLSRNSVSLSLPARFVARRVALFWNLHFFGVFIIFLLAFLAFSLQQAALSAI